MLWIVRIEDDASSIDPVHEDAERGWSDVIENEEIFLCFAHAAGVGAAEVAGVMT